MIKHYEQGNVWRRLWFTNPEGVYVEKAFHQGTGYWEAEKIYLQQKTRSTTWKCGEAVNLQNSPLAILPAKQEPPHKTVLSMQNQGFTYLSP